MFVSANWKTRTTDAAIQLPMTVESFKLFVVFILFQVVKNMSVNRRWFMEPLRNTFERKR